MTEVYLRPEDVSPEHAMQVLDRLNAAESPEEIAAAVEIADELDVGIRLAQRILTRRDQLGGFTELAQIRAIPYIGPERFTEIVITLSDARPPAPPVSADTATLLRELAALRAEVRALRGSHLPPRVTLTALQNLPLLGEPVNIVVSVTEADGIRPRVDAPVTLTATGARLRAVDGVSNREGETVSTRTDGAGLARATLLPLLSEDLLPVQEDSLASVLSLLAPVTDRPRESLKGLRELANRYRWDGNIALRAAVDVYFRDYGAGLLETVNARDYLTGWLQTDVTVFAHLRQDSDQGPEATSVQASAALTVRLRNWLGAWLEALQLVTAEETRLDQQLADVPQGENPGLMVGRVYDRVRDFMSAQRGVVGEYVGRRVAENTLRGFVQNGIANLPTEHQLALFPAIDVASRTVATGGTAMFVAVGQTRTELRKEIGSRVDASIGDVLQSGAFSEFSRRLSGVESRIDSKADVSALNGLRAEMDGRLAAKVDTNVFQDFRRDVDFRFESRVTLDAFTSFQQETATQLNARAQRSDLLAFQQQTNARFEAKADRADIDRLSTDLSREVGTIRTNLTRIDRDMVDIRNRG